eukprot:TRINITY_DN11353_c0_g1_i1.p1 TRINITY_DN11353_c0_g1~~TRINITY_DN11353_c0_g1_i1.p1  ORF type:complete len:194 (+),score=33.69 TRINITY_DN11353_c0_g1_i1:63-644(+)
MAPLDLVPVGSGESASWSNAKTQFLDALSLDAPARPGIQAKQDTQALRTASKLYHVPARFITRHEMLTNLRELMSKQWQEPDGKTFSMRVEKTEPISWRCTLQDRSSFLLRLDATLGRVWAEDWAYFDVVRAAQTGRLHWFAPSESKHYEWEEFPTKRRLTTRARNERWQKRDKQLQLDLPRLLGGSLEPGTP